MKNDNQLPQEMRKSTPVENSDSHSSKQESFSFGNRNFKIIDLEKETDSKGSRDKLLKLANTLKQGQGIKLTDIAEELVIGSTNVRNMAKAINAYEVRFVNGLRVAFLVKPKK